MSWYHIPGHHQDTVVSTRIRFARNLASLPFVSRMDAAIANELIRRVGEILAGNGFEKIDFLEASRAAAHSLVEKHYASPAFIKVSLPHALYLNEPCNLSVMLCEEDHIRLQCILPGLALYDAYEGACKIEQLLDQHFDMAFDSRLGYLTHCPTNLGTAMRASVMLFLPALSHAGYMEHLTAQLGQIGVAVRGSFGEGTRAVGYLYQFSNRTTLGVDEREILDELNEVISQIIHTERELRASFNEREREAMADRVCRAEGILKYARSLSTEEFLSLSSDVRLGAAMGIIGDVKIEHLTALLIETMPATLTLTASTPPTDDRQRDILRANAVRERLTS